MTSTELILEAVEYSSDENIPWWDVFDTKTEASRNIKKAIKEEPDEHQVATLLSYREEYISDLLTAEENYINILKKLNKELREAQE